MPITAIKNKVVVPASLVKYIMRIEPWYEGMPEPNDFNVRGRDTHDLDWGGKLVFYNCIVGGAIDTQVPSFYIKRSDGKNA